MFMWFRYIPSGTRCCRFRKSVRRQFRMFLSRREIVLDILDRLSDTKRARWSVMDDDIALSLHNTIGAKIRDAYGLLDIDNPFVEIDAMPDSDGRITCELFPDNMSQWIIDRVREETREMYCGS